MIKHDIARSRVEAIMRPDPDGDDCRKRLSWKVRMTVANPSSFDYAHLKTPGYQRPPPETAGQNRLVGTPLCRF
jgi:hypothetical protein